jgi:hypothetical protein
MDAYVCMLTEYSPNDEFTQLARVLYTIPFEDIKVHDLMHVLEGLWREVAQTTP